MIRSLSRCPISRAETANGVMNTKSRIMKLFGKVRDMLTIRWSIRYYQTGNPPIWGYTPSLPTGNNDHNAYPASTNRIQVLTGFLRSSRNI